MRNKSQKLSIKALSIKIAIFVFIFLTLFIYSQKEIENQTFSLSKTAFLYDGNQLVGVNTGGQADELVIAYSKKADSIAKEEDKNAADLSLTTNVITTPSILKFNVSKDEELSSINYVEQKTDVQEDGFTINIDGKFKFYVKDKESVKWAIDKLLVAFLPDKSYLDYYRRVGEFKDYTEGEKKFTGINILNDITITKGYITGSESIENKEDLLFKLVHKNQKKHYSYISGSSSVKSIKADKELSDIVFKLNNPNLTEDTVTYNGEKVLINDLDPIIDVAQTFETTKTEKVDYETVTKVDDSLLDGQFEVETEGKEGKREITYENQLVNGKLVSTEKKSDEVVEPPQHKIILVGSKSLTNSVTTSDSSSIDVSSSNAEATASGFIWPSPSKRVTCSFGCYTNQYGIHSGIDIGAYAGAPEYAAKDGIVVTSGWSNYGYGYHVVIDHGNGVKTLYGHMPSQPPVSVGEYVKQGQVIGFTGHTGMATGNHLHFEIQINGTAVDPYPYIS